MENSNGGGLFTRQGHIWTQTASINGVTSSWRVLNLEDDLSDESDVYSWVEDSESDQYTG